MSIKIIDENYMITKPVRYSRGKEGLEVGDEGEFSSDGWLIKGKVQEVITRKTFQGVSIYLVDNIEHIKWIGLEMTDDEVIQAKKDELKKQQLNENSNF